MKQRECHGMRRHGVDSDRIVAERCRDAGALRTGEAGLRHVLHEHNCAGLPFVPADRGR
jgi:hypothetical protein